MLRRAFYIAAFSLLPVSVSAGEAGVTRIIECSNAQGMSYDLARSATGWEKEEIKNLAVSFLKPKSGAYDLIIKDGVGDTEIKAFSKGYRILVDSEHHATITLDTSPLGIFEIFQLELGNEGRGNLFWIISKNGTPPHGTTKSTTYVMRCSY